MFPAFRLIKHLSTLNGGEEKKVVSHVWVELERFDPKRKVCDETVRKVRACLFSYHQTSRLTYNINFYYPLHKLHPVTTTMNGTEEEFNKPTKHYVLLGRMLNLCLMLHFFSFARFLSSLSRNIKST